MITRTLAGGEKLRLAAPLAEKTLCCRGIVLCLWHSLFECDRNVPPYLNRQDYGSREQKRSHGDVSHGCYYHGQFRLYRVPAPRYTGKKRCKAEA